MSSQASMPVANAEASLGAIDIRYTVFAEVGSGVVSGSLHVSMIRLNFICKLRLPGLAEILLQADYEVYVSGSPWTRLYEAGSRSRRARTSSMLWVKSNRYQKSRWGHS
jgi:hypothetical protein